MIDFQSIGLGEVWSSKPKEILVTWLNIWFTNLILILLVKINVQ